LGTSLCYDFVIIIVDKNQTRRLIPEESVSAVSEFLYPKSSFSAIHYWPSLSIEACEEHTDTGILTFLTHSNVPGLEVYDLLMEKYVKIDCLLQKNEVAVIIGEKVPLFSYTDVFQATHHRVRNAPNVHRYSLPFLLDVAK